MEIKRWQFIAELQRLLDRAFTCGQENMLLSVDDIDAIEDEMATICADWIEKLDADWSSAPPPETKGAA